MGLDDSLDDSQDHLEARLEEEDTDEIGELNFESPLDDPRVIPSSDSDIDTLNRILNEKYFGGNYSR